MKFRKKYCKLKARISDSCEDPRKTLRRLRNVALHGSHGCIMGKSLIAYVYLNIKILNIGHIVVLYRSFEWHVHGLIVRSCIPAVSVCIHNF